jgi:HlyD family secretion protein
MRVRTLAIIILPIALVTAIAIARVRGKDAANPGERDVVRVESGTVRLTVSADGILQPLTTVAVKSYAGGAVEVLPVEVGDMVKAGDLIAKIDPTDSLTTYNQAVADLNAAQARLRQAQEQSQVQPILTRAAIAQAEANYNSALKDLERLQKATQPQARAAARAALDKAKANADIAEKELVRTQGLKEEGFVPQSAVDTAVNRRDLAQAELANAQERWDTLNQELSAELESAQARVAQAKAGLDRARADAVQDRLKVADVSSAEAQVARAQAQVDNARIMLDYTTVRAPRAGVILEKAVEQGTIITSGRSSITQGTDIVTLGDLTKMFAEVSLDEADVGQARVGQQVEITIDAFPDQRFRGVVTRINPQAVTQQNVTTVLVKVEIENPKAQLKPGMTASCEFLVNQADNVLYLPSRAVREVGGQYVVSVLKGGQVTEVPVTVGLVGDDRIEIRGGLTEGQEVVLPSLGMQSEASRGRAVEFGRRAAGGGAFFRSSGPSGPPPPPR